MAADGVEEVAALEGAERRDAEGDSRGVIRTDLARL
jgi:hypothetical protein